MNNPINKDDFYLMNFHLDYIPSNKFKLDFCPCIGGGGLLTVRLNNIIQKSYTIAKGDWSPTYNTKEFEIRKNVLNSVIKVSDISGLTYKELKIMRNAHVVRN